MEIINILVQHVGHGAVGAVGSMLTTFLIGRVIQLFNGKKSTEIEVLLRDLGTRSKEQIRVVVQNELGNNQKISNQQREELTAVLFSLASGVKLMNSQGGLKSSLVRSEGLIEQLLQNIQVKRKAGEAVAPGHNWTLQQFLGMGSFGEVWLATNDNAPRLKRAYKFFTHEGAAEWLQIEKDNLLTVADRLGEHPQIVKLEDVQVKGHLFPFLVLEYVPGGNLEDWILEDADRRVVLRKHELVRGMARALAKAHEQCIYHRDLKPANILLTQAPDVQAKIADFGLGTVKQTGANGSVLGSSAGWQVGTPMYWPPEAQNPLTRRSLGFEAQADVFAIGVIWYQLLLEKLERPSYDFITELRDHGHDSQTIRLISRCLAHPSRRFNNAGELTDQIDGVDLPEWNPPPEGMFNVSSLVREYIATK